MSKTLAIVNTSTDTWVIHIARTNDLVNALATEIVTANTLANGSVTTGNAYVNGIFGSLTLFGATLRGGNVQASANLTISSNVFVVGNSYFGNSTANVVTLTNSTVASLTVNPSVSTQGVVTIVTGNSTANVTVSNTVGTTLLQTGNYSLYNTLTPTINVAGNNQALVFSLNSTANVIIDNSQFIVRNTVFANSSGLFLANIALTAGFLSIGNSTINSTANSSMFESDNFNGTTANITSLYAPLITSNSVIVNTQITVGNSTVNVIMNTTTMIIGSTVANGLGFFVNGSNVAANGTTLRVGNSTVNAIINATSLVLSTATTTTVFNSGTISNNQVYYGTATTTNVSAQLLDSFLKSQYRLAEYLITIKCTNANNYMSSKVVVMDYDATGDASLTEWGRIISNTDLGAYTSTTNATHVLLNYTPTYANNNISFSRNGLLV